MSVEALDHASSAAVLLRKNRVLNDKIRAALDCDGETASRGLVETLRFMHLVSLTQSVLTPPQRVDLVWHEFILFTRTYERFCKDTFGRFVHHTPGGTNEANRKQFQKSIRLYREHFGEPDPLWWYNAPPYPACGACETF